MNKKCEGKARRRFSISFQRRLPICLGFPAWKLSCRTAELSSANFLVACDESMKSRLIRSESNGKRGCFPRNWIKDSFFFINFTSERISLCETREKWLKVRPIRRPMKPERTTPAINSKKEAEPKFIVGVSSWCDSSVKLYRKNEANEGKIIDWYESKGARRREKEEICVLFLFRLGVREEEKKENFLCQWREKAWNMKEKYDGMKFHSNKRHTAWINI